VFQLEEPLLQTAKEKMMKLAEAVSDIGGRGFFFIFFF
jgi:hypothetical protein